MIRTKAFTLIELLIVVAIIAILAAIAVPNFLEAQVRSKVSRSKADMRTLATAIESYHVDNNRYPVDGSKAGDGEAFWYPPTDLTTPIAYITSLPLIDPFRETADTASFAVDFTERWYRQYRYRNFKYTYNTPSSAGGDARLQVYNSLYGAWELLGNGPDKSAGPFIYPTINGVPIELSIPYDPTNGTISDGNMIRGQATTDGRRITDEE